MLVRGPTTLRHGDRRPGRSWAYGAAVDRPTTITEALERLAANDPALADEAAHVASWMAGGDDNEDPAALTLAGLQTFLWYELPTKWMIDPDDRTRTITAAAKLFETLGRPRYIELCHSPITTKILDAYDRSDTAGRKAFRTALNNSPVDPPDLTDFAWGSIMGLDEASARATVETGLETALDAGRFSPGVGMWRAAKATITAEILDTPQEHHFGQTWRSVIITERLRTWTNVFRSPTLASLRAAVANQLLHPVAVPDTAALTLEPVLWLCDALSRGGAPLTKTGNLGRAFVHHIATTSGWWKGSTLPRSEDEFYELHTLHAVARTARLAQHEHDRFMLNIPGISSRANINDTWARVARSVAGSDDFAQTAFETVAGLLLADTQPVRWRDAIDTATDALSEYGWQQSTTGTPSREMVTARAVERAVAVGFGRLRLFGTAQFIDEAGHRQIILTDDGRTLLHTFVRERAAGPRHDR